MKTLNYLPELLTDKGFWKDISILIDHLLNLNEKQIEFIRNKYSIFSGSDTDVVRKVINEFGYGYILELFNLTEDDLMNLVSYIFVIHFLKGNRVGLELVLRLLKIDARLIEWWESIPRGDVLTYTMEIDILESVINENFIEAIVRFSREYVYPLLKSIILKYQSDFLKIGVAKLIGNVTTINPGKPFPATILRLVSFAGQDLKAEIQVNKTEFDYGTIDEGGFVDTELIVTNVGGLNLFVNQIAQKNPLKSPFFMVSDNISLRTILPTRSAKAVIRFSPATTGSFSDSFDISSNDLDNPSISINVKGVAELVRLEVRPPEIVFDRLNIGEVQDVIVTVFNTGKSDLTFGQIGFVNPLANPFSIVYDNVSNKILRAGESNTFAVRFSPVAEKGLYFDSFDIPYNVTRVFTVNVTGSTVLKRYVVGNIAHNNQWLLYEENNVVYVMKRVNGVWQRPPVKLIEGEYPTVFFDGTYFRVYVTVSEKIQELKFLPEELGLRDTLNLWDCIIGISQASIDKVSEAVVSECARRNVINVDNSALVWSYPDIFPYGIQVPTGLRLTEGFTRLTWDATLFPPVFRFKSIYFIYENGKKIGETTTTHFDYVYEFGRTYSVRVVVTDIIDGRIYIGCPASLVATGFRRSISADNFDNDIKGYSFGGALHHHQVLISDYFDTSKIEVVGAVNNPIGLFVNHYVNCMDSSESPRMETVGHSYYDRFLIHNIWPIQLQ